VPAEYIENKTVLIKNNDGTMNQGVLQIDVVMPND
jgi:hypothetical protein